LEETTFPQFAMVVLRTSMLPGVSLGWVIVPMPIRTADGGAISFLDTGMLTTNVNALYGGSAQTWASNLATRITVIRAFRSDDVS
jgi:hypothetical protein